MGSSPWFVFAARIARLGKGIASGERLEYVREEILSPFAL